jgi:hypothetical protein
MWFKTEKEAEEACKQKEIEFGEEFVVQKDSEKEGVYWATRKSAVKIFG